LLSYHYYHRIKTSKLPGISNKGAGKRLKLSTGTEKNKLRDSENYDGSECEDLIPDPYNEDQDKEPLDDSLGPIQLGKITG